MGNQGCWVEAGMLVLPRGTHRLPICVFACLAGTPSATDRLLHVCAGNVNEACPAALLVLLHVRDSDQLGAPSIGRTHLRLPGLHHWVEYPKLVLERPEVGHHLRLGPSPDTLHSTQSKCV